jgi:hypothetical protein
MSNKRDQLGINVGLTQFFIENLNFVLPLIELVPELSDLIYETVVQRRGKVDPTDPMTYMYSASILDRVAFSDGTSMSGSVGVGVLVVVSVSKCIMVDRAIFFHFQ